MSDNAISIPVSQSEVSQNILYASYSEPIRTSIPQNTTEYLEHRFSSENIFPNLNEYSKINAADITEFSSLSFAKKGIASLKLIEASGSFKNVLGHYQVDNNGVINNIEIAFSNTRSKQTNETHQFNINANNNVHLFVIANGFALNKGFLDMDENEGTFSFVYRFGEINERLAKITDITDDITLIYAEKEGNSIAIRGPIYHTTNDGVHNDINPDSHKHAVSGFVGDDGDDKTLRVGFEDFPGLGDADYNDVVVDMTVVYATESDTGEVLYGEEESIPLYDSKNTEEGAMWGINPFNSNFNFDFALNDESEEREPINIDDILIDGLDTIDKIIVSNSSSSDNSHPQELLNDSNANVEAMASSVDYIFPNLETPLDTIV